MNDQAAGGALIEATPDEVTPARSPLHDGRIVGHRYELYTPIGSGGMGTVWSGHDKLLRRDVAIKEVLIHDGLPQRERDMLCERTLREARAAARLDHSAVIRVYDVVNDNDQPWIVMELLDARSLADIIKDDGPIPEAKVAEIGLAVLSALEAAHRVGILHRDIKPGNVLLCSNGRIVLTDFGVARSPNETPLTSTGLLLGSPQYIAPERARGRPFGPPSDLFSLGATLYAAVEGRPPFDRGDPIPTMTAVVVEPPDPMSHAAGLQEVLLGLLEKDPATRWDPAPARAAMRAIVRAARRAAPAPTQRDRRHETAALTESPRARSKSQRAQRAAQIRGGRHRRPDDLLAALARPIVSAAEATAAIVVPRTKSGRHSHGLPTLARIPDTPPPPATTDGGAPVLDPAPKRSPAPDCRVRAALPPHAWLVAGLGLLVLATICLLAFLA